MKFGFKNQQNTNKQIIEEIHYRKNVNKCMGRYLMLQIYI